MGHDAASLKTRPRLLEAAGEIFARDGFRNATVRDICRRARANVAAVNYHFGNKRALYAAVLQYAFATPEPDDAPPPAAAGTAARRLEEFIAAFLRRFFNKGRPAWGGKLMAWEMIEPSDALDTVVRRHMRPRAQALEAIVGDLLGPGADEAVVRHCAQSIVAQCLFYHHCRSVITRLYPQEKFGPDDIGRLAAHIASFSLGALETIAAPVGATP